MNSVSDVLYHFSFLFSKNKNRPSEIYFVIYLDFSKEGTIAAVKIMAITTSAMELLVIIS